MRHGLYLASWEYLYLRQRKPAGLPNQLFFHHPWLLIPFENIYCDQNAYDAEWKAWKQLGWTNSGLFVKLAERGIIQPIATILARSLRKGGIPRTLLTGFSLPESEVIERPILSEQMRKDGPPSGSEEPVLRRQSGAGPLSRFSCTL